MSSAVQSNSLLSSVRAFVARYAEVFRTRPGLSLLGVTLLLAGLSIGWFYDGSSDAVGRSGDLLQHGQPLPLHNAGVDNPSGSIEPLQPAITTAVSPPASKPVTTTGSEEDTIAAQTLASPSTALVVATADHYAWQPVKVSRGDSLGSIFKQRALSPALVHQIVNLNDDTGQLTRLNVGEVLDIAYDRDGQFNALRRAHNEQDWLLIEQAGTDLSSRLITRELSVREREANGVITGNLFVSGKQAGMRDGLIMQLARIFGWDIDFALDIRRGDRFVVIYEEIWRDGEFLRDGGIIAASFVNQGEVFKALRYATDSGFDYFTPEGKPMRKAFLRTPLDFARVTSNFNPRRMHPVLKRVRPHNGVDYGAPTGTPVYAAGDGTVIASAYSAPNGNYVFIRHTNDIVTKYLHFSRKAVKKGQRVKQGQTIGYVGSTGLATAAHLHYEFVVSGVHRNPRTVDLPEAIPLNPEQTRELLAQHELSIARLDALDAQQSAIAYTSAGSQ